MFSTKTLNQPLVFWSSIGVLTFLSIAMRFGHATPDVSWLISMCERIIDGEIAYVDIFETTPPVPTLLYMPGALLSRVTPLSAEAAVYITTYLSTFLALVLTARILPRTIDGIGSSRWLVIFPAAFALLILTSDTFAQREYFGAAFILPIIAVFIAHAQTKQWPGFQARLWACLLAGLSIAIKPPVFAAPGVLIGLYYLTTTRDFRGLYSSGLIAGGAGGVAITALSLAAFPAYLDGVTTLMHDVYVPIRANLVLALNPAFTAVAASMIGALVFSRAKKPPQAVTLILLGALGYVIVYFVQGKFFAYHLLPASCLAFVAIWILSAQLLKEGMAGAQSKWPLIAVYAGMVGFISITMFRGYEDGRALISDMTWAEDLDQPTAMAISPVISTSFPLARQIDAVWIDRIHSQWVARYTRVQIERQDDQNSEYVQMLRGYYDREIDRTRRLIQDQQPELIFQAVTERVAWLYEELLEEDPALMDEYTVIAEEGILRIWRRNDAIEAGRQGTQSTSAQDASSDSDA